MDGGQHNQTRVKSTMIVDLKTHKRLRPNNLKGVDQPVIKIPSLQKTHFYREGTREDILKLLKDENIYEDEGVFLKGKVPSQSTNYVEKILQNGGFSNRINLYQDKSMSYVCKELKAKMFNKNEVRHMCQLNDVNICEIYGFVRKTDEYHIYMEYCGTNLYELTKTIQFHFDQIVDITKQLCMAVEFAHNKKILHLDIKPQNICLLFEIQRIVLKLTDWGSSKPDNLSTEVQSITLHYASPELLYLHISQTLSLGKIKGDMLDKAIQLTQNFCANYNNIERVSTKSDSFSIGLTIMHTKTKKHLYERCRIFPNIFQMLEMFAENPNAARDLLNDPDDILICIIKKLIEGDSHKRSSVKEVQKMITNYQKNSYNSEVTEDTRQSDNVPLPETRQYNVPNFDMLF